MGGFSFRSQVLTAWNDLSCEPKDNNRGLRGRHQKAIIEDILPARVTSYIEHSGFIDARKPKVAD